MPSKEFNLTKWPVYHSPEVYESSIDSMCTSLKSIAGIKSIYQVGGISDYGISDIDMLVIFENRINFSGNPFQTESKPVNRYLFTHRLFGTTENRINDLENFTRFGKYKLLHGQEFGFVSTLPEKDIKIVETQIALEYMLKAFISLHVALTYGQVKVRNLLLHVKALRLDLELVEIKEGLFYELVNEFIEMRKTWFQKTPAETQLKTKISQFYQSFRNLLESLLEQFPFYLTGSNAKISRNIKIKNDARFFTPDFDIPFIVKKLIPEGKSESIFNRVFSFCFRLPVVHSDVPDIIQQRFKYLQTGVEYNKVHLSNFLCTAYGMDIFSHKS